MCLNIKIVRLLVCFLSYASMLSAQADRELTQQNNPLIQIRGSYAIPFAFGDNFLAKGFDLKSGFGLDGRIFIKERIYLGISTTRFKGEAKNLPTIGNTIVQNYSALGGSIEKSSISRLFAQTGYSFLPRNHTFGLDAGLGLGYTVYTHSEAGETTNLPFKDDGIGFFTGVSVSYNMTKVSAVYIGAQFSKDFLFIKSPPELEQYFKNANMIHISAGIQFRIQ